MKYTVVVVAHEMQSSFIVHTEAESALEASEYVCEHARQETGIYPYFTEAIFEGHITPINVENNPYHKAFKWRIKLDIDSKL